MVPAVVDGIGSAQANEQLDNDFALKSLHDQTIKPYSMINGLIFVPSGNASREFYFKLSDPDKHEQLTLSTSKPYLNL